MNLIDLDKALAEAYDECRMSDDWKVSHEMMNVFKYQPIIKAIPIEWIDKYMSEKYSMYGAIGDEYVILHTMLCDWEKENERMDNR